MKRLKNWWRRLTLTRKQREALAFAEQFTAESRQRAANLADAGRGQEALHESLARLGGAPGQRGRLIAVKGIQVGKQGVAWRDKLKK